MKIINRKASFDYHIVDRIEAGISLTGSEVKSLREGRGKLEGSFVKVLSGEAYLINAQIQPYEFSRPEGFDPGRTRKLLLHRAEIIRLLGKMSSGNLTLIPLSWYTTRRKWKLEIGLARGKKQFEKREAIKRADMKKELEREYRGKVK